MRSTVLHLSHKDEQAQLVVSIPSDWETAINRAIDQLLELGNEQTARQRVLDAILVAAEQSYFWTPEWQAGEQAADQAITEERYHTFDSMDKMIAFLDAQ